MAYSTIQGQTPLGTTKPSNLKPAFETDIMDAIGAPKGIDVSVVGMLTNSNPGMYGLVMGYSTPVGMRVDVQKSGSWRTKGSTNYDMMRIVVVTDSSVKAAQTEYWEVWYKQSDVDSAWTSEVAMLVDEEEFTYKLSKKRVGDGLEEMLTDETIEQSGYDRPSK
ncbi:MAG: hypothetical protein IPH05_10945 [Flavobacteriales bacterium]|nr:hypothetical protein [Flavobacteriales bacterium]MBK7482272.1 hypothetical protein [Flavobacteriales bacterium]MBK8708683.1 hypothetical protein [Flavobacteriales bacterium]MBK9629002.1 hypothetical protein [Flavobacteriales bacterium]